jgi:hypothetical protein
VSDCFGRLVQGGAADDTGMSKGPDSSTILSAACKPVIPAVHIRQSLGEASSGATTAFRRSLSQQPQVALRRAVEHDDACMEMTKIEEP